MKIFERIINSTRKYLERGREINRKYAEAYRSCFDGTEEEVQLKLEAWDYAHRITRQSVIRGVK